MKIGKFIKFLYLFITLLFWRLGCLEIFAQQTLSFTPKVYVFNGNGNWSKITNWQSSIKPPGLVPKGDSILVQTAPGDSCVLDVAQYLAEGAVIKVMDGNSLIIKGGLFQFIPADSFFTDSRDKKIYPIKKYGTQIWMTMNLNYNITGSSLYGNDAHNALIYGRLYEWDIAKNACPAGWHLPSLAEWNILGNLIGSGGAMKDTLYWEPPNTGATNIVLFNARPGGFRKGSWYEELGFEGRWWTATQGDWEYVEKPAYFINLIYTSAGFGSTYDWKDYGYSVRCIKN